MVNIVAHKPLERFSVGMSKSLEARKEVVCYKWSLMGLSGRCSKTKIFLEM